MGLKTTNYVSKSTGLTLPTAYAKIKDLVLNGNNGRAIFAIQSTREAVENYQAIDKVEVRFVWDRKSDIAKTAYEAAKKKKTRMEQNGELDGNGVPIEVEVVVDEQFFGWYDDIV